MNKPPYENLTRLEQLVWVDKIHDLVSTKGLALMNESVEQAAKRLYERVVLLLS